MYEEVTIDMFMEAWFKEKYDRLSKEDFDICYAEYIDATGLFATEEFDLVAGIHYLTNKVNSIRIWVSLQRQYILIFQEPYLEHLDFLTRYGYNIKWNGDVEDFEKQLNNILLRDSKSKVDLESKQKKLNDLRDKKDKPLTPKQTREQFIRMMNSLGKIGFTISKKETTVEELALMLTQQFEEQDKLQMKYG
jgi:hypothetical protein